MITLLALALVQDSATATVTRIFNHLPPPVEAAFSAYRDCLFDAMNGQFDSAATFSEREVLSACASVRRAEFVNALARLNGAGWSPAAGRRSVQRRFAELDETVWTVVGHVRARRAGRR